MQMFIHLITKTCDNIYWLVITDIYKVQYMQKVQNDNAYKVLYTKILTTISARSL